MLESRTVSSLATFFDQEIITAVVYLIHEILNAVFPSAVAPMAATAREDDKHRSLLEHAVFRSG